MKRVVGVLLFFMVLVSLSGVVLAAKPEIEFRPETPSVISKGASFVMIVDPKTTERPIRITWAVYDAGGEGVGSFPIVDGKGVCYFSKDDGNATCGPSPFTKAGPTELYVYVVTPSGVENTTKTMNISDIEIPLDDVTRVGNTIYMNFYVPQYDSFTYKIYFEDFSFFAQGTLERDVTRAMYTGNKTLNPGVYYFAFFAEKDGNYGTNLARIEIPSGDYITLETSKDNYWIGEKAGIKGTTNAEKVSGRINFPNGTKAKDFETSTETDGTFSYEFRIPSTWPEGKYNVTTSTPLPESVTFSAADLIQVTPKMVSEVIESSEDFSKVITLKNLGANETNLTVSVGGDLSNSQVALENNVLDAGASTTLTITIPNVQVNIAGTITIKTDGIELEIPVNVYLKGSETPYSQCPPCEEAQLLEITPKVFSQDCITGNAVTQSIVIHNKGSSKLTGFTFDVTDIYSDNSLSDLKSTGDFDIALSGVSIEAGGSESVDMEITPYNSGTYRGVVTIQSGGSKAYMVVNLECFEDMSEEITSLAGELENLGLATDSNVYTDINYLLGNAQDAYDVGNYREARSNLDKAKAKIVTVQDIGGAIAQPVDPTIPIIVIAAILVVVFIIYFFRFRQKGTPPSEEEFEEEF